MANDSAGNWILVALMAVGIYNCSGNDKRDEEEQYLIDELGVSEDEASDLLSSYSSAEDAIDDYRDDHRDEFDEYAARRAAEDELASEGYDYSYGCTDDCSGHEAGWQWRAENGYSASGTSQSFAEGGWAFDEAVEERVDEMRDEYEEGASPY